MFFFGITKGATSMRNGLSGNVIMDRGIIHIGSRELSIILKAKERWTPKLRG